MCYQTCIAYVPTESSLSCIMARTKETCSIGQLRCKHDRLMMVEVDSSDHDDGDGRSSPPKSDTQSGVNIRPIQNGISLSLHRRSSSNQQTWQEETTSGQQWSISTVHLYMVGSSCVPHQDMDLRQAKRQLEHTMKINRELEEENCKLMVWPISLMGDIHPSLIVQNALKQAQARTKDLEGMNTQAANPSIWMYGVQPNVHAVCNLLLTHATCEGIQTEGPLLFVGSLLAKLVFKFITPFYLPTLLEIKTMCVLFASNQREKSTTSHDEESDASRSGGVFNFIWMAPSWICVLSWATKDQPHSQAKQMQCVFFWSIHDSSKT